MYMKKILNLFAFRKEELENKWWGRFAKVLIYGIALAIFIVFLYLLPNKLYDLTHSNPQYIYSFEQNYKQTFGVEEPCTFVPQNSENTITIDCGRINGNSLVSSSGISFYAWQNDWKCNTSKGRLMKASCNSQLINFLERYGESNSNKEEFLMLGSECKPTVQQIWDAALKTTSVKPDCYLVNFPVLNEKIEQGEFSGIKVKRIIFLNPIVGNVLVIFIAPILWLFLMKSVIYKLFKYIILGKKTNKSNYEKQ